MICLNLLELLPACLWANKIGNLVISCDDVIIFNPNPVFAPFGGSSLSLNFNIASASSSVSVGIASS